MKASRVLILLWALMSTNEALGQATTASLFDLASNKFISNFAVGDRSEICQTR